MVKRVSSMQKGLIPQGGIKSGMRVHIDSHSAGQVETGGSEDEGHPWQQSKFKASLGYVTLSQDQTKPLFWQLGRPRSRPGGIWWLGRLCVPSYGGLLHPPGETPVCLHMCVCVGGG